MTALHFLNALKDEYQGYVPQQINTELNSIDADLIVAYDSNNNPIKFSSDIWDFRRYSPGTSLVKFNFSEMKNKYEIKSAVLGRLNFSPSARSLSSTRILPFKCLDSWAFKNSVSLTEMLSNKKYRLYLGTSLSNLSYRLALEIVAIVRDMRDVGFIWEKTPVKVDEALPEYLDSFVSRLKESHESYQTPVIPSRLFGNLILCFEKLIDDLLNHSEALTYFYDDLNAYATSTQKTYLKSKKPSASIRAWAKHLGMSDTEVFSRYELNDFFSKYSINNKKQLNKHIRFVQEACAYWIHFFTGMRRAEVERLTYDCLNLSYFQDRPIYTISGYTSKFTGQGRMHSDWITSEIVVKGVSCAKLIANIYKIDFGFDSYLEKDPLFPSQQPGDKSKFPEFKNFQPTVRLSQAELSQKLSKFESLLVSVHDIRELEMLDGFREWSDVVKVGAPWPLATHQCRRSLAVYLARSGLVSLGALQKQFKHLNHEMTAYYRRGSGFSSDFFAEDSEQTAFSNLLVSEKRIAEFLQFEDEVISNPSNLWGGEGTRIKRSEERGAPLPIIIHREDTLERFKQGKLAYKSSPLGACMKIGSCDNLSITDITPCISCEYSVLNESSYERIQQHMKTLQFSQSKYPIDSIHFKFIQDEINSLDKILFRRGGDNE